MVAVSWWDDVSRDPVLIAGVGAVVVVLVWFHWWLSARADAAEAARAEAMAARRKAGRARGEEAARVTGEHRTIPEPTADPVRFVESEIHALRVEVWRLRRELSIREEPDEILRVLLDGPMTAAALSSTLHTGPGEIEGRLGRLCHITNQVQRIVIVDRDPVYTLRFDQPVSRARGTLRVVK